MPKVSDAYKEEKRASLLQSALHCFAEKGFQATTIEDIVKHTKTSKGMIYTYFRSKEEIFLQLVEEQTERMYQDLMERFATMPDALSKLRHLLQRYRQNPLSDERRSYIRVQLEFFLYSSRQEELKAVMEKRYERFLSFVQDILEEGKRNGEFRSDADLRMVSAMLWAISDGIYLHFSVVGENEAFQKIWSGAEDLLLRYLTPTDRLS